MYVKSLREDGGKRVTKNRMWYQLGLKIVLVCFYLLIYASMVHGNGHSHCNICLLRLVLCFKSVILNGMEVPRFESFVHRYWEIDCMGNWHSLFVLHSNGFVFLGGK